MSSTVEEVPGCKLGIRVAGTCWLCDPALRVDHERPGFPLS